MMLLEFSLQLYILLGFNVSLINKQVGEIVACYG